MHMWGEEEIVSFTVELWLNIQLFSPAPAQPSWVFLSQYDTFLGNQFSSVQSLSHVQLFATPWIKARQASLSITNSRSLPKLVSIELVMSSSYLISSSVFPFSSCLWSFPATRHSPVCQFASGGQSTRASASASVLPVNIQDWFPLALTGLISLQSKGLSRVFSILSKQNKKMFKVKKK